MFHLALYEVVAGVNDSNVAMAAITDPIFTKNTSGNLQFFEQYQLIGACHLGASVLRCRFNIPSLNQYGRHMVWPVNRSLLPLSPTKWADWRDRPFVLPVYDSLGLEESGNLGAATEEEVTALLIATMDWSKRVPQGYPRQLLRTSQSVTAVAKTWAGATPLVFSDTLYPGWYAVTGMFPFEATSKAARLIFSRMPPNVQRNFRPGCMMTNAVGNIEYWGDPNFNDSLGFWGAFHSTDLPQIEIYSDSSGAVTVDAKIWCTYLGGGAPGQYPSIGF